MCSVIRGEVMRVSLYLKIIRICCFSVSNLPAFKLIQKQIEKNPVTFALLEFAEFSNLLCSNLPGITVHTYMCGGEEKARTCRKMRYRDISLLSQIFHQILNLGFLL